MIENLDSLEINFDSEGLWVLNITLAIIMFGVALGISVDDFKRLFKNPKILLTGIISQFFILPLVTFIFIKLVNPMPSIALGLMMVAACPGGNISNFLTQMAKGNAALSVSLTAFATLLSMVMTPFNLHFWGNLYAPTAAILQTVALDPLELVKLVTLILGIPLILGMWVRNRKPIWATKLSKILKPISLLIFLSFIVIAFYDNFDIFINYIHYVLILVIAHNVIALLTGFYFAKVMRLSHKDQKTLSIETGIQNSGLGLLLIFSFFHGLGGMALLVAFWAIWDIVSGLALASYWSKQKKKHSILKNIWYNTVKYIVKTGLFFTHKKIKVYGKEHIPKNGAILFIGNHQNALLDAILIPTTTSRNIHFLTRASAFKTKIADKILRSINMIPVYRLRDGKDNMEKNIAIFKQCFEILKAEKAIQIFAEGEHHNFRSLLPLKKGFARIILGTLQNYPELEIRIIPVGINYDSHLNFPSSVSLYYGKPILANPYFNLENPDISYNSIKTKVSSELKKLTTHIENLENHDEIVEILINSNANFLDPVETNKTLKNLDNIQPKKVKKQKINWFAPIHLFAKINSYLPLLIWWYLKPKIKDIIFTNTFRFALILTVFPLFYLIQAGIISAIFSYNYGLVYLATCIVTGIITTKTSIVTA